MGFFGLFFGLISGDHGRPLVVYNKVMPKPIRHKLYPEPGAWVLNQVKGLPIIDPPDGPVTGKLTTREVADQVEYHGLGLCVYSYLFPERIADKELAVKWKEARKALVAIVEHLNQEDQKVKQPKTKRLNLGDQI